MIHFFLYCFRWGDTANFCAFVAANAASAREKAVKVGKRSRNTRENAVSEHDMS